jgi:NhaA family Na+:H+ antiporter
VSNERGLSSLTIRLRSSFQEFTQSSSSAGIVILICTAIAMIWANSAGAHLYHEILRAPLHISLARWSLDFSIEAFVNDGLMVLFFLVVGLEIKRELLVGELSSAKKAALPMIAAVFGMVGPAVIYLALNAGTPQARGWGTPVATDIAFALGILALLGNRVPLGLKVFLAALAIVDDLLSVLVIALFYSGSLNMPMVAIAGVVVFVLFIGNRLGVHSTFFYGLGGVALWLAFLGTGIHTTVAGVILAITIPSSSRITRDRFAERLKGLVSEQIDTDLVHRIERLCERVQSPLHRIEHGLQPWVSFAIMPVFALVNAGVEIKGDIFAALTHPASLGIILGLFIGKQLGVTAAVWASIKLKIAELPERTSMMQIYGVSILCGIGFTMALFVAHLAFATPEDLDLARISIIAGSTLSAVVGRIVLRRALPR